MVAATIASPFGKRLKFANIIHIEYNLHMKDYRL